MKSPSLLSSGDEPLFLDTSVLINLLATGQIERIQRVLRRPFVVEEAVVREMKRNPLDRTDVAPLIRALDSKGVLRIQTATEQEMETLLKLVSAPAPDDLDDGEAATIAIGANGLVATDDKKARRILARDFPETLGIDSLDIIAADEVVIALGLVVVRDAAHDAFRLSKMHCPMRWEAWLKHISLPAVL